MFPRPLLVLLAMLVPSVALGQEFSPCEVRELAGYWKTSEANAQAIALGKLRGGLKAELADAKFMAGKLPVNCAFHETRYTPADAELLAAYWGTSPGEAKRMVEEKISNGLDYYIPMVIEDARKGPPDDGKKFIGDEFFAAGYAYCDARVLAAAWEMDPYDAKISAAHLLRDGKKFDADLKRGWKQMRKRKEACDFWETSWYPGDAELLAQVWGMTLDEAKARIGRDVAQGRQARLWRALAKAKR